MTKRALVRTLEREREAHSRQIDHLLDVICHLAKNPWAVAPARMDANWPQDEPEIPLTVVPDQWADDELA